MRHNFLIVLLRKQSIYRSAILTQNEYPCLSRFRFPCMNRLITRNHTISSPSSSNCLLHRLTRLSISFSRAFFFYPFLSYRSYSQSWGSSSSDDELGWLIVLPPLRDLNFTHLYLCHCGKLHPQLPFPLPNRFRASD